MAKGFTVKSGIRDYKVDFTGALAKELSRCSGERDFLVIDKFIAGSRGAEFRKYFAKKNIVVVDPSETKKTLNYSRRVIDFLLDRKVKKNSVIYAVGGGVIQDISGFVSSVLYRGINWYFFPTTLLAQADSCIGSKTSINYGKYKNLLGSFYPPSKIFIDIDFLDTLPCRDIKSGIGEMLHYFFIDNKKELAAEITGKYDRLVADRKKLKKFILNSLEIKRKMIERDEFDRNKRNIFNYGHTFGHAVESISGYKINHGQAVTMGMDIANYISFSTGLLSGRQFGEMRKILSVNMPDFLIDGSNMDNYMEALQKDKKNISKDLTCILTRGFGGMFKTQVKKGKVLRKMLLDYRKEGKA